MRILLSSCVKMRTEVFSDLPAVVLDKILSKLSDEDLRSIYQVSKSWKNEVVRRPKVNQRRQELVEKIRQNKENIIKGSEDEVRRDASRTRTERNNRENSSSKPGSRRIFDDCRNTVHSSSNNNSSHTSQNNVTTPVTSTPNSSKSIFDLFEEAKGSLTPGQKLITCKKCYGPVASPISSRQDPSDDVKSRLFAPRCDLTSRMSSVGEPVSGHRERKKPRSHSTADINSDDLTTSLSKMVITNSSTPEAALNKKMQGNGKTASTPTLDNDLQISMNSSSVNCNISNLDFELITSTPSIYDGSFRRPNLNNTFSPVVFRNDSVKSGGNLSTNLCDSGLSMSCIISDDECNDSQLSISTIQSPEPVKNVVEDRRPSLTNLNHSKDVLLASSDSACKIAVCNKMEIKSSNVQDNLNDIVNPTYPSHNNSNSINCSNSNCTNEFRMPADYVERSNSNQNHSQLPMLSSSSGYKSISYSDFNETDSLMRDSNRSSLYSPLSVGHREDKICQDIPKISFVNQPFPVQSPKSNLSRCSENLNESIVVECPNCSLRLCSICEEKEHIGRRCLIIDGDYIQDSLIQRIVTPITSRTGQENLQKSNSSMGSKGKGSGNQTKKRLRRLLVGK